MKNPIIIVARYMLTKWSPAEIEAIFPGDPGNESLWKKYKRRFDGNPLLFFTNCLTEKQQNEITIRAQMLSLCKSYRNRANAIYELSHWSRMELYKELRSMLGKDGEELVLGEDFKEETDFLCANGSYRTVVKTVTYDYDILNAVLLSGEYNGQKVYTYIDVYDVELIKKIIDQLKKNNG